MFNRKNGKKGRTKAEVKRKIRERDLTKQHQAGLEVHKSVNAPENVIDSTGDGESVVETENMATTPVRRSARRALLTDLDGETSKNNNANIGIGVGSVFVNPQSEILNRKQGKTVEQIAFERKRKKQFRFSVGDHVH